MRLSKGKVHGERLICPYHGWNFAPDGTGKVPSTANARVCTTAFDATERYGAIWVKAADSVGTLPQLHGVDHVQAFCLLYHIAAPLELVVDNFAEIEHSVTTHVLLAHDADGIAKTDCEVAIEDEKVFVRNVGPQKSVFKPFRWLLGYDADDLFVGEGEIKFQPVHLKLSNYWLNPETQARRYTQMSGAVFFNPVSATETDLMLFGFTTKHDSAVARFMKKVFLTAVIHVETILDKRMMEGIADKNPAIEGMKLGRFDRPLFALRERIQRLYWGNGEADYLKIRRKPAIDGSASQGQQASAE